MSHDMTEPTKWLCAQRRLRSAWASAQSDQSLRCALMGSLGPKLSSFGQRRLRLDWADAQADLSLRWAHMPFCWFCQVVARVVLSQRNAGITDYRPFILFYIESCIYSGQKIAAQSQNKFSLSTTRRSESKPNKHAKPNKHDGQYH